MYGKADRASSKDIRAALTEVAKKAGDMTIVGPFLWLGERVCGVRGIPTNMSGVSISRAKVAVPVQEFVTPPVG